MSIIRTYFTKNNTIITDNRINNSQNPVTEISYGLNKQVSRYIFDVDFDSLKNKLVNKGYNEQSIKYHKLVLYNTISIDKSYTGTKFQDNTTQRTSSFKLDLFKIEEDWDEGNGYEFIYTENEIIHPNLSASNWIYKKTNEEWNTEGIYLTGDTQIIESQYFDNGNENIEINITDYVNNILFSGDTTHKGFGLKFEEALEELETKFRQAVAFHTKYTHTFFEPYIETKIDDTIVDDRNYFYIDKDNYLYFFFKIKNTYTDVIINNVEIINNKGEVIDVLLNSDVEKIYNGVYRIPYKVDSAEYPDRIIFYDKWNITINGLNKEITQKFYIKPNDSYFNTSYKTIDVNNFHITMSGINYDEIIINKEVKPIRLFVKSLYDYDGEIELSYNLYIKLSNNHIIPIIENQAVDRMGNQYGFDLDTSWLKPQDYYLDIYVGGGYYKNVVNSVKFKIPANI